MYMRSLEPFCGDVACRVFCILLVKEPHFWLKSCSRELRNFFEIRPFAPRADDVLGVELCRQFGRMEKKHTNYYAI